MKDASFWISVVAICIAVASAIFAGRADKRAYRAEHRDERREQREEEAASESRRGRPIVIPRGGSGGPTAMPVRHEYEVRNGGPAIITALWLWIDGPDGSAVSTLAGGPMALVGSDSPIFTGVDVVTIPPPPDQTLTLMVRWQDSEGEHEESTGIRPSLHF